MTTKKTAPKGSESTVPVEGPNSEVRMTNEELASFLAKRRSASERTESIKASHTITKAEDAQGTVTTESAAPHELRHSDKTEAAPGNEEK